MSEVIVKYSDNGYGNVSGEIVGDIVRCKECKWYGNEQKKIYECCTYWAQDGGVLVPTKADDFCSYGERKESE